MIFVFGSNLHGFHGKGAAKRAFDHHGAIWGQAEGLQGESYAIPTKGHCSSLTRRFSILTIEEIHAGVTRFLEFARQNPQLQFQVTRIGCGLAGYKPYQIAPLFRGAPANVHLDREFKAALDG